MKPATRPAIAAVAIAVGVALWVRYQLLLSYGGAGDYLAWADEHYFGGITRFYVQSAFDLVAGKTYVSLAYPPGYPLVLSSFVRGGAASPNAMRMAQIAVDSATVVGMFGLARICGLSVAAGVGAAWLYALHPLFATGAIFLLGESLTPALCVVLLLAVAWAGRRGPTGWMFTGVLAGAAILIRPDLLVLAVLVTLGGLGATEDTWRRRAMDAVAMVVGVALVLGPWGLHNRTAHGVWVFTSTGSGATLYEGLGDLPNPYGFIVDDSSANHLLMAHDIRGGPGTPEANAFFRQQYRLALAAHPGHVARAIVWRWRQILFTSERLQPLYFGRLREVVDATGALACLVALFLVRRQPLAILLVAAPILSALLGIGLVHYEPRYVRYAQLSYVFASVVLLELGWRRLASGVPPHLRLAGAGVVGAVLAIYSAKQLVDIHSAAVAALALQR